MDSQIALFEHVPIPGYVFRAAASDGGLEFERGPRSGAGEQPGKGSPKGDCMLEFVLEEMNAAARAQSPAAVALRGRPMAWLYRDQPEAEADARRCLAEQRTVVRAMAVRRHDRTEVTQDVTLSFVPLSAERLAVYVVERHTPAMSEAALSESEARYRSLVASLPDALLVRGSDARVLACNEAAERLFGADSSADLIGQTRVLPATHRFRNESGEAVDEDDTPSVRVITGGEPELARLYTLEAGARRYALRVSAQPIHGTGGAITGSVTTFTDITERSTAEEALRRSVARLDLALDAARLGVWEFDAGRDIGWWSPNLGEIFALSGSSENLGGFVAHLHPDDRASLVGRAAELAQAPDGHVFQHDFRIVGSDGVTRWARAGGRLSRASGAIQFAGTLMDVTSYHHLEEELRRAHRLESIGRLAGGIAHDFNNLLAAMMGSLELVTDVCPPEAREDLATVRHGAVRARDLTRQLLAFARKQPVVLETVNLGSLVANVERMLRRLVGPEVEIAVTTSSRVLVHADPALLEQVLVNLVVNGRDAMPQGGRLAIRVTQTSAAPDAAARACIEVADSGAGMDEDTKRHVFEPFFTTKAHGTGLGLASSYGIVQQHGGDIVVESVPGAGTCFRVLLPLLSDAASVPPATVAAAPSTGRRGTILVVDDDDLVRRTAVRLLANMGYEVLAAASGDDALACSRAYAGTIDVVLCDLAMPGRDGPATAAALRAERPDLAIVFTSGFSDTGRGGDLPGSVFLPKPYSRDELAARLREVAPVLPASDRR